MKHYFCSIERKQINETWLQYDMLENIQPDLHSTQEVLDFTRDINSDI